MIVTEAMLVSMEELQRHAGDMENHVKSMMEEEGRRHGLELDRRRNARELWNELNKHMANPPAPVAVDHEGEIVKLLSRCKPNRTKRLRFVAFTISQKSPDTIFSRVLDAAIA